VKLRREELGVGCRLGEGARVDERSFGEDEERVDLVRARGSVVAVAGDIDLERDAAHGEGPEVDRKRGRVGSRILVLRLTKTREAEEEIAAGRKRRKDR